MKFLLINGSPHKGNTWKLVEQAKKELLELDSKAEFDEIHLSEVNLPFCLGCSNCFRKGMEKCPHYSIMGRIVKQMEEADGVIVASTTFNTRETALLKNFFDHLCFMMHRPHFFKSKALVIATAGGVGAGTATKSIAATLKGIGFNKCYRLAVAAYSWNAYEPRQNNLKSLKNVVGKFYKDVVSKKLHSPEFKLLIPYNLFRGMCLSYVKGTEFETEDGVYWTVEKRMKTVYCPEIKVSMFKRIFGNVFYIMGKTMGKNKEMQVTYKK